jgi:peptidoglycan/xylan/chitin deacetylase (PgdA/CDA1 family)
VSHPVDRSHARSRRRRGLRQLASQIARALALYAWRPLRDALRTLRRRHPVRVFTFHRITDACRDGMTVSPELFRRQLDYVRRTHDVVTLEEALGLLATGARLRRPAAVITFDDGYRSVFDEAFPLMTEVGVPGCCFVTTGLVGTDRRFAHDEAHPASAQLDVMGWNEVFRLQMTGWTVGAHSETHSRLSALEPAAARAELERPLEMLRSCLGNDRIPLAFPFGGLGDFTEEHVAAARELGYAACFSNHGGENFPPADPYRLKRIDLGGDHQTLAWKMMARGLSLDRWRSVWERYASNGREAPS